MIHGLMFGLLIALVVAQVWLLVSKDTRSGRTHLALLLLSLSNATLLAWDRSGLWLLLNSGVLIGWMFWIQSGQKNLGPKRLSFLLITLAALSGFLSLVELPMDPSTLFVPTLLLFIAGHAIYLKQEAAALRIQPDEEIDQRRTEWVSMVAHELRGPVGGIVGLADLMIDGSETPLNEKTVANLELISQNGRRLTHLLNDLLDAERIKTGEMELDRKPVHLRSLANRVLATNIAQAATKSIELVNKIPADIPNVMADSDKIEQVLFNLVNNSLKFTDSGKITVRAEKKDDVVEITIEDTGKGFAQQNLERILDKTEEKLIPGSLNKKTSGLGLKIITRLLEMHDSELTVATLEGIGSSFSFKLPATDQSAAVDKRFEDISFATKDSGGHIADLIPSRATARRDKYEIMIVDDETINLRVLNAQLKRAGYKVIEFFDGYKALKHIQTVSVPDLILLDVMMPGINGFEVLAEVRKQFPQSQVPVILVTAKNQGPDILSGFQAGANDYVTKPIAKDELLARIKTHLELSKVHQAFSYFVPIEFLKFLGYKSILDIQLGDQVQKHMTVLFSDIKDFSRISERMSPKESFDFINTFLGTVSPVIRQHGGFIDKFIGDAIMALFPGTADDALAAAIDMTTALKTLNVDRLSKGLEPIQVGTGVHTGDLMLGTVGEEKRMDGTVISDAVNTASRMEGLTKVFDTAVVISSKMKEELTEPDRYHFKYLGKAKVKGKQERIDVFGVIEGDDEDRVLLEQKTKDEFEKGIKAFYERDFTGASVCFNNVLKQNPADKAAAIFLKRSASLMVSGVPSDWDGIEL
jgi:two-component system sensor histidine kinase ChiS